LVLSKITGLSKEELGPVLRLALVFATIGGAVAVGDATVQAVFVARVGADRLPEVLFARAVISPALAFLYARFARPREPRSVLSVLLIIAATGALTGRLLITHGDHGALAAYVVHEVLASLVTVHWGVYLLHVLRGAHALKGTPSVYAAARLGAALAGAALAPLVAFAGAPVGLYVTAALFGAAAAFSVVVARRVIATDDDADAPQDEERSAPTTIPPTDDEDAPPPSIPPERRRGFALLFSSPLLLALSLSTAAMVFVRFSLRYQQQSLLEGVEEHQLAALLAVYTTGANVVGAAIQLGLLGRVLERLGLTKTNLFYAVATLAAQVAIFVAPGIGAALGARFADSELKHAIKTPLSSLFYEAFPAKDRGAARAFVLGLVSPAAQVLGAVGLAAAIAGADVETVGFVGLFACLFFALATLAQNRGYDRARPLP
jgi:hypothetical protein